LVLHETGDVKSAIASATAAKIPGAIVTDLAFSRWLFRMDLLGLTGPKEPEM